MTENNPAPAFRPPPLLPIWPETAHVLGMSRPSTYYAVRNGDIQTVVVNGILKAVTAALEQKIGRRLTPEDLPVRKKRVFPKKKASGNPANLRDKVPTVGAQP